MLADVSSVCIQLPAADVAEFICAHNLPVNASQRFEDQVIAARTWNPSGRGLPCRSWCRAGA